MALVDLRRVGNTAMICFNRPPLNALDLDTIEAFGAVLNEVADGPPAGGVVVTGAGKAFTVGVDTKAVAKSDAEYRRRMVLNIDRMAARLFTLPTAVVAAVNGHAIGGGLVVAMACDWRFFSDGEGKFGLTEVSAGVPYPAVPIEILQHELAPATLRRLVLGGELFGAREALSLGLADDVVPTEAALIELAIGKARQLASQSAYRLVKAQFRAAAAVRMAAIVDSGADPLLSQWNGG